MVSLVTVVKLFSCNSCKKGPTFILQRICTDSTTEIEFKGLCCLGWSINNSFEGIMNNDRINFYGTTRRTESSARLFQKQILSQGSVMEEKFYHLIRCVNYIQEQSDEAISLGDSVNRAVGEIMNRMEVVDFEDTCVGVFQYSQYFHNTNLFKITFMPPKRSVCKFIARGI